MRIEQARQPVETSAGDAGERDARGLVELGHPSVDDGADRPFREPAERHELAARPDRLRDRPEIVGHEHDDGVLRRLLEVLEERIGGVLVHQLGREDQVDAPIGLERPHVEVAAQLADRVDPDHLSECVELVEVGMHGPGRAEQLEREGAGELPLADARRSVEEVGVNRPLDDGGIQQALRLVLLARALEPAHAPAPRSCPGSSDPSRMTTRPG